MEHKLCGEEHAHEKHVQTKRRAANAILSSKGKKDASNLDLKIRKIHILWCSSEIRDGHFTQKQMPILCNYCSSTRNRYRLCNGSHSPSMESTKITSDSRFDGGKATDAAAFDLVDLQNVENEGGIEVLPVAKGGDGDRSGLSLEAVGGQ